MKKILIVGIIIIVIIFFVGIILCIFSSDVYADHFEKFLESHLKTQVSLVNLSGDVIIPFGKYDEISDFALNKFRRVKKNNKYGFINNKTGKLMILCKYDIVGQFTDKITYYKDLKTGKYGFIDINDKIVISPIYKEADVFRNGLAKVSIDGKHYGYINNKGKIVIPLEYNYLSLFNDLGFAQASIDNIKSKSFRSNKEKLVCWDGYIDKKNKRYKGFMPSEENKEFPLFVFNNNKKYGVKDKQNKIIVSPKYKCVVIDYKNKVIIAKKNFWLCSVFDYSGKQISKDFKCNSLSIDDKTVLLYKIKIVL